MFYVRFIVLGISLHELCAAEFAPFSPPLSDDSPLNLFRRANSKCAASCSSMGGNVCCGKKTVCALDQAGNVACCPNNSVCTGTIAAAAGPPQTAAPSAPTPGAAISHAISGTSTLTNQHYPFPVLATPFANVEDCTKGYSSCQAESAKCTGYLEGGGYGVTVSGQDGQVTQQAAMPVSSAESICSSLSQEACHGLQLSLCTSSGEAEATGTGTGFQVSESSNNGVAPTRCKVLCGIGLGLAIGLTGKIL